MVENRRRTTKQRLAIRALFDDESFFLTAQQVHDQLRERGDQVGLATVYRNLQTMAEDGELDAIRSEDGEITDAVPQLTTTIWCAVIAARLSRLARRRSWRTGRATSLPSTGSARPDTNWSCSGSARSARQRATIPDQRRSRGVTRPSSQARTSTSRRLRTPSFFAR